MAVKPIPPHVDTVIVGNGPSALILSFILHGNTPYYNPTNPHPDSILHKKLTQSPCLLDVHVDDLTAHFAASRLSYSTQALPINVLLDTLIRPLADTDPNEYHTRLEWTYEPGRRVPHVVLGNTAQVGGQWADNPVSASWDIGALSYAGMLSLPGYSFEEYYKNTKGGSVPNFYRPTRREVAAYLAVYYKEVGIQDSVHTNIEVGDIRRTDVGFYVASHNITCRHLVLASGIFSKLISPRPSLRPLYTLSRSNTSSKAPLLVVGSGFTAADVIISTSANRKIIHIFKWDPENRPSPLRACHPCAYPEYASVYKRMKLAAKKKSAPSCLSSPRIGRDSRISLAEREWNEVYEGLPNTFIKGVAVYGDTAHVSLETGSGTILQREVANMEYVIGRRGSLSYLNNSLAREFIDSLDDTMDHSPAVSGRFLRAKVEKKLELSPGVFAIGSLTGDSLIRYAYGSCVFAAREIMKRTQSTVISSANTSNSSSEASIICSVSSCDETESGRDESISDEGHPDPYIQGATCPILTDHRTSICEPLKVSN